MPTSQDAVPETELKFELGRDAIPRLSGHALFGEPGQVERLCSTYFDTPDHALRHAGFSLRVRRSGDGFVQTVKQRTAGRLLTRDEWETPVACGEPDLDELGRTPIASLLDANAVETLAPVFETRVERTIRMWRHGGTTIELSLDQGEVTAGKRREAIQELELELKGGDPAGLFALAHDLSEQAPLALSFESKSERGYRLADHDGLSAVHADEAAVTARMPACEAFRAVAGACLAQIAGNAQLFRRARSPEILHQLRVGLRRLRAALKTFRPMVADDEYDSVAASARSLARALDRGRDLDVFIHGVLPDGDGDAEDATLAALRKRLSHAQAAEYDKIAALLDAEDFPRLVLRMAAWVEVGPWTRDDSDEARRLRAMPAARMGEEMLDKFHRKLRKASRRFKRLDVEGRHRLRLRAKRLRYAGEFFAGAFPEAERKRRTYMRGLKDLQDVLGELNDLAVAERRALEFVGEKSPALIHKAGILVGESHAGEAALLRKAARQVSRARNAKTFWGDKAD